MPSQQGHVEILQEILKHQLTVDKLTESISSTPSNGRSSDASDALTNPDPVALTATLENYKEYFSKLRFSYLEQMTKEKFLHMIVADPPVQVETADNEALEAQLKMSKAELQERKQTVQTLLGELETLSRRIAPVYEEVSKKIEAVKELPEKTDRLQNDATKLEAEAQYGTDFGLPLSDTRQLYADIESELVALEKRMETLIAQLPKRQEELQELQNEISVNEASKEGLEKFASDAIRQREGARAAGKADRENTGQWYKSSYEALSALLSD